MESAGSPDGNAKGQEPQASPRSVRIVGGSAVDKGSVVKKDRSTNSSTKDSVKQERSTASSKSVTVKAHDSKITTGSSLRSTSRGNNTMRKTASGMGAVTHTEAINLAEKSMALSSRDLRVMMTRNTNDVEDQNYEDLMTGEEILDQATSGPAMANLINYAEAYVNQDIKKVGIYRSLLTRVVLEDELLRKTCATLPTTFLFMILFIYFFQSYYQTSSIFLQEDAIRQAIASSSANLREPGEIYDWLDNEYFSYLWSIPNVHSREEGVGDSSADLERPITDRTANFQLLGGVIMHTARGLDVFCFRDPDLADFGIDHRKCNPEDARVWDADSVFVGWSDNMGRRLDGHEQGAGGSSSWFGSWFEQRRATDMEAPQADSAPKSADGVEAKASPDRGSDERDSAMLEAAKLRKQEQLQEDEKAYRKWQKERAAKRAEQARGRHAARKSNWRVSGLDGTRTHLADRQRERRDGSSAIKVFRPWTWFRLTPPSRQPGVKDQAQPRVVEAPNASRQDTGVITATAVTATPASEGNFSRGLSTAVLSAARVAAQKEIFFSSHEEEQHSTEQRVSSSTENSTALGDGRRLKPAKDELALTYAFPLPGPDAKSYGKVIPMRWSRERISREIASWRQHGLIKRNTYFLSATTIVRNHASEIVTRVDISFSFSRGGTIFTTLTLGSLRETAAMTTYGALFAWIVCLLIYSYEILKRALTAAGHGKCAQHLAKFENQFELLLLLGGWVILIVIVVVRLGLRSFQDSAERYMSERAGVAESSLDEFDASWFKKLYEDITMATALDNGLQSLVAYYQLVLIFRFLLASRGQPRLAIVVATMSQGIVDLFHLFIVFLTFIAAFISSGHILFGRRMQGFSTVLGSIAYTMRIVFSREYEWRELTEQDMYTSFVWIGSLMFLVVVVLINIILAMIFDIYGDVRNDVTEGSTLYHTMKHFVVWLRNLSDWQKNEDLLLWLAQGHALRKGKGSPTLTAKDFRDLVPGLTKAQVLHLFVHAQARLKMMVTRGNKNLLAESVATVLLNIAELQQNMRSLAIGNAPVASRVTAMAADDIWQSEGNQDPAKRDEYTASGVPVQAPFWLDKGLTPYLQKQQQAMQKVHNKLAKVEDTMIGRGMRCSPSFAFPMPVVPDPFEKPAEAVARGGYLIQVPKSTFNPWQEQTDHRQGPDPNRAQHRIEYDDGAVYNGEVDDAELREGWGIHNFADGAKYEGEWHDDKAHGYGVFTQSGGYGYTGQWADNFPHGTGEEILSDGSVFRGFFKFGKRSARRPPAYMSERSSKKTGRPSHIEGRRTGPSPERVQYQIGYDDGASYVGEMNDSELREGYGTHAWADGAKYTGEWENDKAHGFGEFSHPDGSGYKGEWVCNLPHGHGTERLADGSTFKGFFKAGNRVQQMAALDFQSQGLPRSAGPPAVRAVSSKRSQHRINYDDGAYYVGEVGANSVRQGWGRHVWPDGCSYEGQWANDKAHGSGVFKGTSGSSYSGQWVNNVPDGEGEETLEDGSQFTGTFRRGHRVQQTVTLQIKSRLAHLKAGRPCIRASTMMKYTSGMRNQYRIDYDNGSYYVGEVGDNETRHGWGKHLWNDGAFYAGHWSNDEARGSGEYRLPDGCYYRGHWLNYLPQGEGEEMLPDGSCYTGLFQNGLRWQPLESLCSRSSVCGALSARGGAVTHQAAATGTPQHHHIEYDDGTTYVGTVNENGLREGWGKQTWADGREYTGQWLADSIGGAGSLRHLDGSAYEGQWAENLPDGEGTYQLPDGSFYRGAFAKGLRHGQGNMAWADGATYQGAYEKDRFHGEGTFKWADGSTYKGQWSADKLDGAGVFTSSSGLLYDGEHARNLRHGVGRLKWPDGAFYTGGFMNDNRHGFGLQKRPDGSGYKGEWADDVLHGAGTITNSAGETHTGRWCRGKEEQPAPLEVEAARSKGPQIKLITGQIASATAKMPDDGCVLIAQDFC